MSALQAAWRDASFTGRHGRARVYHVMVDELAACNRTDRFRVGSMLLNEQTARPATGVPVSMRCRRPGCARLWPSQQTGE